MAVSEAFVRVDASLPPLGCLAAKAIPSLLPFSGPGVSWCGLQGFSGVQEAFPGAEPFLGGKMVVELMPVVFGLFCAFGLCGNGSTDVRGGDAREGIKAVYQGCFDAPGHNPAGVIEDGVQFAGVAGPAPYWAGIFSSRKAQG